MASIKTMIDAKIAGKKVMVFSKTYCPYCTKGKNVLQRHVNAGTLSPSEYEVMEIENHPNCGEIQDYLYRLTGAKSVPRVFINGKCIGGGNETVQLDTSGKLAKLLS